MWRTVEGKFDDSTILPKVMLIISAQKGKKDSGIAFLKHRNKRITAKELPHNTQTVEYHNFTVVRSV